MRSWRQSRKAPFETAWPSAQETSGEQTILVRDAGQPHLLNVSRSTIYTLRHDPDFKREVPIVYVGNVPFVFVSDITKYKELLRGKAVDRGRPRIGRPRKIAPTGKR